jgi:hypothetical protein
MAGASRAFSASRRLSRWKFADQSDQTVADDRMIVHDKKVDPVRHIGWFGWLHFKLRIHFRFTRYGIALATLAGCQEFGAHPDQSLSLAKQRTRGYFAGTELRKR